eukprot:2568801-Amphidinium_carterae.1
MASPYEIFLRYLKVSMTFSQSLSMVGRAAEAHASNDVTTTSMLQVAQGYQTNRTIQLRQ